MLIDNNLTMKRLLIFHSALAPYRIDFFNALARHYLCHIVFLSRNNRNQPFQQEQLLEKAQFEYSYMDIKLVIKGRDFNCGYLYKILKYKPDIIIGGEYGLPVLLPLIYRKLFRKKYTIYTICDDSLKIAQECSGIRKCLRKFIVKRIEGIIFISRSVADWYAKEFKVDKKWIVFPIIKNENLYHKILDDSYPISLQYIKRYSLMGLKVVLYVGRLTEVKNISTLISAFSLIKSRDNILVIVGEGDLKNILMKQVESLNLSGRVLFVGRFEGNALYAWYNLASLFVLPSIYEPFGAVSAEALQAGCPVLCSKNAGSSSLISPGVNGDLFDPLNVDNLAELMETYLSKVKLVEKNHVSASILTDSFEDYVDKMIYNLD